MGRPVGAGYAARVCRLGRPATVVPSICPPEAAIDERLAQILRHSVKSVRGGFAAALFEDSGIMVGAWTEARGFRPDTAADAFVEALRVARRASDEAGTGDVQQLIIETSSARLLIHHLAEHYVVGLGLDRDGNLGQARLALKRLDDDLKPLLER